MNGWFDDTLLWGMPLAEIVVAVGSALLLYAAMLFGLRVAMKRASSFAGTTRAS